jgi:PilZ domain
MNENRRLQERKQPERMVFCKLGGEERGSVLNLSENGLCFESLTPIEEKELLQVRLSVDLSDAVEATGQLAWIDAAKRTGGLRFLELSAPAREQIRLWLGEPSPTEAPEGVEAAAPAEKLVASQEMPAPSTLLVPIERYRAERRWQFCRGVLVGFGICAAMAIPIVWYAGGARSSKPAQASAIGKRAGDSRGEAASVTQVAAPDAAAGQAGEVTTVNLPSTAGPTNTQRQIAPQPARTEQPLSATAGSPLFESPAGTAPGAATQEARSFADKAQRPRKITETPQQLWSAVQAGNTKAAVALAELYMRGEGVPVNCDQARVLLLAAAEKNNAEAPKKLQALDNGGCPASAAEAKR